MNMPGFTAENSLYRGTTSFRTAAATPAAGSGTLTPALKKNAEPGYINCKDYPDGQYCRECGNTGPGSMICCPNDHCIINNPPEKGVGKGGGIGIGIGKGGGVLGRF